MATPITSTPPASGTTKPPRSRQRRFFFHNPKTTPYLFIAPFLVVFVLFFFAPLVYALRLSLFRQPMIGEPVFVGLANYTRAFADSAFHAGIGRIVVYGVMYLVAVLVLGLTAALLLDSGVIRLKRFFRLAIFVPYAVPSAVAALMWGYLYSRNFGPLADVANALGRSAPDVLSARTMLVSITNITVWTWVGYVMIIFYTALQAVPVDVEEAAAVDGATRFQIAWHIKLPLIRPAVVLVVFFSIIGSMQLFNEPHILSAIRPQVIDPAYTPNLYAFNLAFSNQDFPYSAAISFIMGIVAFVTSYAFMLASQRGNR